MSDPYTVVADRVHTVAGVVLQPPQRSRLRRSVDRAAARRGATPMDIATAATPGTELFTDLLDAALVGETHWFRDPGQLDTVVTVLSELPPGRRSVWAPGCSTGQEAYSLAICLHRAGIWPVEIVASDINALAVQGAALGTYDRGRERELDDATAERYGVVVGPTDRGGERWAVRASLRRHVEVITHNLLRDPPVPAQVVLCRNVLIYFARREIEIALDRFACALPSDGVLVLGHAEGHLPDRTWSRHRIGGTFVFRPGGATDPATSAPSSSSEPRAPWTLPVPDHRRSVRELVDRAETAIAEGRWVDAIACLRTARTLRGADPVPAALLGLALAKSGDVADARESWAAAVDLLDAMTPGTPLLGGYPASAVREWIIRLSQELDP